MNVSKNKYSYVDNARCRRLFFVWNLLLENSSWFNNICPISLGKFSPPTALSDRPTCWPLIDITWKNPAVFFRPKCLLRNRDARKIVDWLIRLKYFIRYYIWFPVSSVSFFSSNAKKIVDVVRKCKPWK